MDISLCVIKRPCEASVKMIMQVDERLVLGAGYMLYSGASPAIIVPVLILILIFLRGTAVPNSS